MARYKFTESGVYDKETGFHIPADSGNRHWQEFQAQGGIADPIDLPPIEEVREKQLTAINAGFERYMAKVQGNCPPSELATWQQQEEEARAYLADNKAKAKLLKKLSATRGMSMDVLAQKVVDKADVYADKVGKAIGRRQALEGILTASTSPVAVEDVVWTDPE